MIDLKIQKKSQMFREIVKDATSFTEMASRMEMMGFANSSVILNNAYDIFCHVDDQLSRDVMDHWLHGIGFGEG